MAAAATIALAGCSEPDSWLEQRRFAMGTWVDTIHARQTRAVEQQLARDIDSQLRRYEIDYYAWTQGELNSLNAALADGQVFEATAELAQLLSRARTLSARSGGMFDPGVGAAVEAWGFHAAGAETGQPENAFLRAWADNPPGVSELHIEGNRISSDNARLVLDLGGIAKGEVVDRLLDSFAAAGISDALINAGGDVRVLGKRGSRHWSIGIQSPREPEALLGTIELYDGEAAFTSGDYERFFDAENGRQHHLLDPRNALPAAHTRAITVIANEGALADAAATAIFVAGPSKWRQTAAALGIRHVLRVDAEGKIEMTPAMRERVQMRSDEEPATMRRKS